MTSAKIVDSVDPKPAVTETNPSPVVSNANAANVWVLCRKRGDGEFDILRSFDDEARARADLDLVQSVSNDEFWLAAVPFVQSLHSPGDLMSPVQALALTWLADGALAEGAAQLDDTVQIRPSHVRGFLSVPPEEWRRMEEQGWVRNGLLTPEGAAVIGRKRAAA
ncbi:MAG: hypothetical protein ACI8S3_000510 [Alphaproteobacteria bacterium]|jgi:hypothetical protein